jgi:potassium efflux system protein
MLGLSVALNILGAQWSKLQWLVAALGVGLGFGLQEIVANFISGLLILFERPIRVGDTVTVGSHTGTVTRIRIRATVLTDWDRKEQIIPNKTFITEQLTNWTLSDSITRQIIQVGVAYGSDVGQVHQVLSQVVADSKRVIAEPPPAVFFVGFGDSSLNFEIRVFVQNMLDIMPLIHELHVAIEAELRRHGIEIPFPQRDIWIRSKGSGPALDAEAETE